MIFKRSLIIFLLIFRLADANSQHLSHQVMVPAAGVVSGFGINYSQTLGETAVEIIGAYNLTLTQGFQQPGFKMEIPPEHNGTGVEVYPNPVTDYVKVELYGEAAHDFNIIIININGSSVYSNKIEFSTSYWHLLEIPVSALTRGIYFIRVMSTDGVINRTFKMEKM